MITTNLSGIQIEGNLIAADLTSELAEGSLKGQAPEDFGLGKIRIADEIATAWGDAKAYWAAFQRRLGRLEQDDLATSITREQWVVPLLESLGFVPVYTAKAEVVDGQTYAISHRADEGENKPPIQVIGCRVKLDKRPPSGMPRLSAHALMQEYLNRTEHLWGIVTNGLRWRLLRDSSLMTRLSYVEFDLEQILNSENFAEFGLFYRLFHRSRLPLGMADADACLLEFYHQEAIAQGGRVRDKLRDGVELALVQLGTGFLQHRDNRQLREKFNLTPQLLTKAPASLQGKGGQEKVLSYPPPLVGEGLGERSFYRQLLLLIYRLLFLMVAESRNLLLAGDDAEKARIYQEYYSISRLREVAEQPSYRREGFGDLWQSLRVTFCLFDENWRGELLGLSPLNGGLFNSETLKDLNDCRLDNHDLLVALRYLSLYEQKAQLRKVNYGALDVEELGSVYESLLDFHPQVSVKNGIYQFDLVLGSERKTTGSYYTPPDLVGQLIKSALEPVIEAKLAENDLTPQPPHQGSGSLRGQGGQEAELLSYSPLLAGEGLGERSSDSPLLAAGALVRKGLGERSSAEKALLSIKIVDPACGSGHFLLAAARRIGKELARIRTGETQPTPEPLRQAIRDVIQNCIYGVDLNPLAVDLCKVALWIEGFCRGLPLNFLDHRIKCGNSLVGVLDLSCLDEGIPDEAFKAVTGDDKALASRRKKENKKQRLTDLQGQLSIFNTLETERNQYAKSWQELGEIAETTTSQVKQKATQYQESRKNSGWWRDYSACNLWTAAFFMPLTEQNLQLLPTTAALTQLLQGNISTQKIVDAANKLADEKFFFHWCLEFPNVFAVGGFDCVLGNPPWERIKLQEKEFFASRSAEIAKAMNKAAREKLIKLLPQNNPELAQAWEDAKHDADAQGKFIRESGRFPLTAVGDINTYAVFAETTRKLISDNGRVGVIVPTGIATDDTTKRFFNDLVMQKSLQSYFGFKNERFLFPKPVEHTITFGLLTIVGKNIISEFMEFCWLCYTVDDMKNLGRRISLTPQDMVLFNPNTLTCPVFRTSADAELTKKIYQRVPVLENEKTGNNPWHISFMRMFDMSNDSKLFKNEAGDGLVPLYEAKMFHQFNHRWATYTSSSDTRDLSDDERCDVNFQVQPRYWVSRGEVENKLGDRWNKDWLLGFRRVCRSTDERSAIFCIAPKVGFGDSIFLIIPEREQTDSISCLYANLNSLVFDFITRQKVGGANFNFFIAKQLPIIPPETYTPKDIEYISSRVLELVYTTWDMQPFAKDMGYDGEPFIWNNQRRAILRAELDAYYAKLYGLTRDELRYILAPADVYGADFPSETFRVLKNNEMKQFGEYRTRRLVLAAWDLMFG